MRLAQVDASFQRNPVAFDIYRHLGGWATETEYVNVDWHGRLATACPLGNIPLPGLPLTSLNSQAPNPTGQDYGLYYVGQRIKCGQGRLVSFLRLCRLLGIPVVQRFPK